MVPSRRSSHSRARTAEVLVAEEPRAANLFLAHPKTIVYATSTDSTILYIAYLLGVLILYARSVEQPARAVQNGAIAGALCGLAVLTRSDSTSVIPFAALVVLVCSKRLGMKLPPMSFAAGLISGAVPFVLAWSIRSLLTFGAFWNPNASKVLFMGDYVEAFSYPSAKFDAAHFAMRVAEDPRGFLTTRAHAIWQEVEHFLLVPLPAYFAPLIVVGSIVLLRTRRPIALAYAAICAGVAFVYGVPAGALGALGGAFRSSTLMIPFGSACALAGARFLVELLLRSKPHHIAARTSRMLGFGALAISVAAVVAASIGEGDGELREKRALHRLADAELARIGVPQGEPLMTNEPIDLNWTSGRPTILTPINGPRAICDVARRYGARRMILFEDEFLRSRFNRELHGLLRGELLQAAFSPIAGSGEFKVFDLACPAGGAGPSDPGRGTRP
jgi:hypothetical protein